MLVLSLVPVTALILLPVVIITSNNITSTNNGCINSTSNKTIGRNSASTNNNTSISTVRCSTNIQSTSTICYIALTNWLAQIYGLDAIYSVSFVYFHLFFY